MNLGYTYNSTNYDGVYGIAPPAVGFKFIRGGLRQTGNMNDSVTYHTPFGSNNTIVKRGYKDEGMGAFNTYNGATPQPSDPLTNAETYRVLEGLWRTGDHWIHPITLFYTVTPFSGDPVTGTGWIQPGQNDRRMITITGPFTVNAGDTIIIVDAQLIAKGSSNLNSLTQLRRVSRFAQRFYENNLKPLAIPLSPVFSSFAPGNGKVNLTWNDSAERISYRNNFSGGTYKFEGYNIYQIKTFSSNPVKSDTVLIKTFDINDGVRNISDSLFFTAQDSGTFYGIIQRGSDNGIARSFIVNKDTISNKEFINGTEYKFVVTAYYYDSLGGPYTFPKVIESAKNNIIKVIPQTITPGIKFAYKFGDTISTDQKDLGVIPIVLRPLDLKNALYTSTFGSTEGDTNWTLTKTSGGVTSILFQNLRDFRGVQDTAFLVDGFILIHQRILDSGIVRDPETLVKYYNNNNDLVNKPSFSNQKAWTYSTQGNEWFTAPDTNAVKSVSYNQFDCRSLGIGFPTLGGFRNVRTKIFANGTQFKSISSSNTILTGGPLRQIKIVFGAISMAYRFVPDSVFTFSTPYKDMVEIPFSVYISDELDSTSIVGLRQLNVGFVDSNKNSRWDPDTTVLGGSNFTYIFASNYHAEPSPNYTNKNPGVVSNVTGLPSLDVMYIWLPRVKSVNGVPLTWSNGDTLTVTPYRITRPEFVPGYPVKYSWSVAGTQTGNKELALAEVKNIKVFPNPYYGFSELQFNDNNEKFIYVSHLPQICTIYFYTLDGVLVKKINRNQTDPNNTLEKWDLKNDEGNFVASGMYIVYVDCKELGVKTLKIAVFQNKF